MPLPVYDFESQHMIQIIKQVQSKYFGKANTTQNLENLEKEIVGKLADFGFRAIVDVTPCFEDPPRPIDVRVEERIDRSHDFDFELKKHEVRKSKKDGGI